MSIYVGNNKVTDLYVGDKIVKEVYTGDSLIWYKKIPDYYELATDDDFVRLSPTRFTYIGDKDYVLLPEKIQGSEFELYKMFQGKAVKGVAGRQSIEGSAEEAFHQATSNTLELLYLDTSNVTSMRNMFHLARAKTLNLSSFNTVKVTDMMYMFRDSSATKIIVTSFNTKNVETMGTMFMDSKAEVLDLSSFNLSNVHNTDFMFSRAAATVGYARTQTDANILNRSRGKPAHLNFIVKG